MDSKMWFDRLSLCAGDSFSRDSRRLTTTKTRQQQAKKTFANRRKTICFFCKVFEFTFLFCFFFLFSHLVWRWMQKKTELEVGNYEWKLFCCHSNHIPITAIPDEFVHRNENHLPRTADSKYDSTSKWNEKKQLFFCQNEKCLMQILVLAFHFRNFHSKLGTG